MQLLEAPGKASKTPTQRLFDFIDFGSKIFGLDVSQIVNIEILRATPEASFGRAWAEFLDANHLAPLTSGLRRKQLHDGVHVLTGYGSDFIGEAQVQAFLLGTKLEPANAALLFMIMRAARENGVLIARETLSEAYQRGRCSLFDPDRWPAEKLWDLPLSCVRTCMNL
jgi:ubiquinone biosynthesis protein COQ4